MNKRNEIDMTNGPLVSKMLIFVLPLIATSLLQLLFNAADTIVVGRFVGPNALAAVGATSSLVNFFLNLLVGLSVGANVVIAQFIGAGKTEDCGRAVHCFVFVALIGGLLLGGIAWIFAPGILNTMGTPQEIIGMSQLYLRIFFIGVPFQSIYNTVAAMLRAQGDTKRPLIFLIIAGIINVVLNVFFIVSLHLDVAGVALATIISQGISVILIVRCLIKEEGALHFSIKRMKYDSDCFKRMMKIGLPAGVQGMLFSFSNILIQSTVNSFGAVVVAGNSVAQSIEGFVYVTMNAFQQVSQTFVGQNIGAMKIDRVKEARTKSLLLVTIVGLITGILTTIFAKPLCGIYATDPYVIRAGCVRVYCICTAYFLCGIMDTIVGALRGIGYSVIPMITSLVGACGFRILWILFVFPLKPVVESVYFSYPVTWTITFIGHMIFWNIISKKVFSKYK